MHQHKLNGMEFADTITIDCHKQLYLPVGSSLVLLRDPHKAQFIGKEAYYMLRPDSGDLGKYSIEGSRPGSSLLLHAALHVIGRQGYESLIDENFARAQLMAGKIRSMPQFQLLLPPTTNIVLYRYIPPAVRSEPCQEPLDERQNNFVNDFNIQLQEAQSDSGRSFVSRTTLENWMGRSNVVALRAVLSNPLANDDHIGFVLQEQLRIATELEAGAKMMTEMSQFD
jgi:glutamate/tyrosine decarboxylase-like PLP-dependent enzyme